MTQVVADCPFCRSNGLLKGEMLGETAEAFLIRNATSPKNFLIIPEQHYESLLDLPDNWWSNVKTLLAQVPDLADYNISINIGRLAGQTVKHLHFWVIPRENNVPTAGKGMAKLIDDANVE